MKYCTGSPVYVYGYSFSHFHDGRILFVIINFGDSLSESWHDKISKTTNTKIRLHNHLGYTAAQFTKYLRLVLSG